MSREFQIGRIFGIKINIDWSWLLIFLLIAWNLTVVFGNAHPDWTLPLQIGVAVVAALLFFGSVLAHELAHSLVAITQGVPVRSITLFLFGGVSNIQHEPSSPRAEFLITIVGPLTSVVLGILFIILSGLSLGTLGTAFGQPAQTVAQMGPLTTLLLWLGPINIILGVFNLIPGFPLDGGRVLRSILWTITDDLYKATRWASRVGQVVAGLMIITGIAMAFGLRVPFLGGGFINGLWLVFIGWFLNGASVQSYRRIVVQGLLDDVPVREMMRLDVPAVAPDMIVDDLVREDIMGSDDRAFPVVENDQVEGQVVGMVTLEDVRRLSRQEWDQTTVREIMIPREKLETIKADTTAAEALDKLMNDSMRPLPVLEDGRLLGLLRRQDIARWLQLHSKESQPSLG